MPYTTPQAAIAQPLGKPPGTRCRYAATLCRQLFGLLLLALIFADVSAVPDRSGEHAARWVLIDTNTATLSVMQGTCPIVTLHDIAIGRYGASKEKRRGDNLTPLGRFRITEIRRDSAFHRFIALGYPDLSRAEQAHREGLISTHQLQAIRTAHHQHKAPPQNTALGGHIGIHGLGRGDPALHTMANWTKGCIALTNDQVDTLLRWIRVGMYVEIRQP